MGVGGMGVGVGVGVGGGGTVTWSAGIGHSPSWAALMAQGRNGMQSMSIGGGYDEQSFLTQLLTHALAAPPLQFTVGGITTGVTGRGTGTGVGVGVGTAVGVMVGVGATGCGNGGTITSSAGMGHSPR